MKRLEFLFCFLIVGTPLFIIGQVPLAEAAVQQLDDSVTSVMGYSNPVQTIGGITGTLSSLTIHFASQGSLIAVKMIVREYDAMPVGAPGGYLQQWWPISDNYMREGTSATFTASEYSTPVVFNPDKYYAFLFYQMDRHLQGSGSDVLQGKFYSTGTGGYIAEDPDVKDIYLDFQGVSPVPPTASISIGNLGQFKSDATSTILEGGATTEDTIVFGAALQSSSTDQLQLQIEVQPLSTPFTNQPTATSTFTDPGSFATATVMSLPNGQYHWQARGTDGQNNVSEWQEFGTAGDADFQIHQVPLYTQVRSQYPPRSEEEEWADLKYGSGNYAGCYSAILKRSTIGTCGCAITSAVMILRYYGITTAVDNQDINPLNFNNWLNTNTGYTAKGNLDWVKVSEYSKNQAGLAKVHYDGSINSRDVATLDAYVETLKPTILYNQSFGHFLVADGKLSGTYTVKDPAWYNTRKLDEAATDVAHKIRDYNNDFAGIRLYAPTLAGRPVDGISLNLASPAELLVIDPSGRRLGKDLVTGIAYSEIPGGSYGGEGIGNVESEIPTVFHETKSIWIPQPESGIYTIKVIGTGTGGFTLNALEYDTQSNVHSQTFTGDTAVDKISSYVLDFTPEEPQNISVIATSTFTPLGDTYLKEGTPNKNQGAESILRIRESGKNRAIIKFNQTELQNQLGTSSTVLSAKLKLSISNNGDNWGNNGSTVDVHRLTRDWTEPGATWNCANDVNISNSSPDCLGDEWEMGKPLHPELRPWIATSTDTILITNGMRGVVVFDVTADIQAFLAGIVPTNYGWIIKKTDEGVAGLIELASKETANPPELIVNYEK